MCMHACVHIHLHEHGGTFLEYKLGRANQRIKGQDLK